jgi:hypothetical protein
MRACRLHDHRKECVEHMFDGAPERATRERERARERERKRERESQRAREPERERERERERELIRDHSITGGSAEARSYQRCCA